MHMIFQTAEWKITHKFLSSYHFNKPYKTRLHLYKGKALVLRRRRGDFYVVNSHRSWDE